MQKKIEIDFSIYPLEKVKEAIIDYQDAAIIKLEKNNLLIF
jgi:hypothetical protein